MGEKFARMPRKFIKYLKKLRPVLNSTVHRLRVLRYIISTTVLFPGVQQLLWLFLDGVRLENGIYGHSRFCNTDFDDKLACLNLSGV